MIPILAAVLVFVLFVALNRELLYSAECRAVVFVLPFLLTFGRVLRVSAHFGPSS